MRSKISQELDGQAERTLRANLFLEPCLAHTPSLQGSSMRQKIHASVYGATERQETQDKTERRVASDMGVALLLVLQMHECVLDLAHPQRANSG